MKKVLTCLAVALMSISLFATPTQVPTSADLQNAGYNPATNVVLCLHCDPNGEARVCNDIVLAGNYHTNAADYWNSDPDKNLHFAKLPGFVDWYVVEFPFKEQSGGLMVKPIQLKDEDGVPVFYWDFQPGDPDAWVRMDGSEVAYITTEYGNESQVTIPNAGAYIYELLYWKNHKSPCVYTQKYTYTIYLLDPTCEANDFAPAIIGDFDGWTGTPMNKTMYNGKTAYVYQFVDEADRKIKFREASSNDWSNQLQYKDELGNWQDFADYLLPVAENGIDTTIVFDYSDPNNYRYPLCGITYYDVEITAILPAGAPAAGVELMGSFKDGVWTGEGLLMEIDAATGAYKANIKANEGNEFTFREVGNWDNKIQVSEDGGQTWEFAGNFIVGEEMEEKDGRYVINLDLSDATAWKWAKPTVQEIDTISVTRARERIDAQDTRAYYVAGVVSGSPSSPNVKGEINVWLTDIWNKKDSLQAYRIKGKDNEPWESLDDVKAEIGEGDTILVYAPKLKYYAAQNIYETDGGYYVEMLGKYVEDPTIIYDTLTVAEAKAICDTLGYNGVSEAKYYIEGYAVYADPYNIEYMNQTFFMVDDPAAPDSLFEAYTATPMKNKMAYPVLNGDKVRVFGHLKKYIVVKDDRIQLEVMEPTVEFLEEVAGDRTIIDTISVEEALAIGKALAADGVTENTYVIEGYISHIVEPYTEQYGYQTFWIADSLGSRAKSNAEGAFEIYRGKPKTNAPILRDAKIRIICKIRNYRGKTIENDGTNIAVEELEPGVEEVIQTVTVKEAVAIGKALASGATTSDRYEITGYVSSIVDLYDEDYKNETFWISDTLGSRANSSDMNAFEVYRGRPNTWSEIGLNAKVRIVTIIKNNNGKIVNDLSNIDVEVLEQGALNIDTISVQEAVSIITGMEVGSTTSEYYVVQGYIAEILTPYDSIYGNMTITLSDKFNEQTGDLTCYRVKVPDEYAKKAVQGAYVYVFGKLQNYRNSPQVAQGGELILAEAPVLFNVSVNYDSSMGSVTGGGAYSEFSQCVLTAIPNKGYQFNAWSDGNTDNPRQITVTQDSTFTAIFGTKMCSWLVESNDLEMGAVITTFENEFYKYGTQITVEASPNSGYKFVKWNDGKKYNPYKFSILDDKYLLAIFMAEEEEPDTTSVQPTATTATFTWSFVDGGYTYALTIYLDEECTIPLCTITFNQNGQLIGIQFANKAPRRTNTQEEGFTYTISGLDANTKYYFKMETKDEDNKLINTDEGTFKTTNNAETGIEDVISETPKAFKLLRNGQILILRDNRTYTITGQEVK